MLSPVDDLDAWVGAAERALALLEAAGLEGEVRAEAFHERSLAVADAAVTKASRLDGAGLGVRVRRGARSGYAATTNPRPGELRALVDEAARMAGARPRPGRGTRARPRRISGGAVREESAPEDDVGPRLDLVRRAARAGRDAGKEVVVATANLWERTGERLVLRTDGARARWSPRFVTLDVTVVSRAASGLAKGRDFHGGSLGLGDFAGAAAPEALGERAGRWAAERIDARRPPAGRARAVIDPLLAGVLAHESLGHLAEGDLVASGWSLLRGRVGRRLGSAHATVRDAGMPPEGAGGVALPFDDEGTPAGEVTVVDRGVLRGFLHDRTSAGLVEGAPAGGTGNARALDYRFAPLCRMRNTYFAPGDLSLEEALEEVGDGLYACGSTGGEARSDGNFMFTVVRAYRVRGGEVGEPLRDVAILGNVLHFLRNVRGACDDLRILGGAHVNCGKFGQWPLPVAYGGPHLLVEDALFGGEGTSWGAAA